MRPIVEDLHQELMMSNLERAWAASGLGVDKWARTLLVCAAYVCVNSDRTLMKFHSMAAPTGFSNLLFLGSTPHGQLFALHETSTHLSLGH